MSSRANLIKLLPHLASLRVYDNSIDGDPKAGIRPQPVLCCTWRPAESSRTRARAGAPMGKGRRRGSFRSHRKKNKSAETSAFLKKPDRGARQCPGWARTGVRGSSDFMASRLTAANTAGMPMTARSVGRLQPSASIKPPTIEPSTEPMRPTPLAQLTPVARLASDKKAADSAFAPTCERPRRRTPRRTPQAPSARAWPRGCRSAHDEDPRRAHRRPPARNAD